MAEIVEQLSPLRQTFQAGAEIADTGQASLFFPRTASTLVQVNEMFNSLITTAENFKKKIESTHEDFDAENLLALIDKIKASGNALKKQLMTVGD
jgi:hypothetical protein